MSMYQTPGWIWIGIYLGFSIAGIYDQLKRSFISIRLSDKLFHLLLRPLPVTRRKHSRNATSSE